MGSTSEATDQDVLSLVFAPPSTGSDFLGKVGLNLALGLVTSFFWLQDFMLGTCMLLVEGP